MELSYRIRRMRILDSSVTSLKNKIFHWTVTWRTAIECQWRNDSFWWQDSVVSDSTAVFQHTPTTLQYSSLWLILCLVNDAAFPPHTVHMWKVSVCRDLRNGAQHSYTFISSFHLPILPFLFLPSCPPLNLHVCPNMKYRRLFTHWTRRRIRWP